MNLSVAIITFNEERILERTLKSVENIADEIIVIDSFSTDSTLEICKKFPKVKFLQRKFDGFGIQKNFAIENCSGKWILFLDADEIPDDLAKKSIHEIVTQQEPEFKVYNIGFNNIFLEKILKYGGWGNLWRERFFMRNSGKYSEDIVHESFETPKDKGKLRGKINHYTYENIRHHMDKSNKIHFDDGRKNV